MSDQMKSNNLQHIANHRYTFIELSSPHADTGT